MEPAIENEIWVSIAGFEGFYEVSNRGQVRSLDRYLDCGGRWGRVPRFQPGKMLRTMRHTGGYRIVTLWKGGAPKVCFVHKLVLEAFVGPRPPRMEVAHGDGSKDNNRLENLRWATPSENQADRERHGTGRIGKGSFTRCRVGLVLARKIRDMHAQEKLTITELAKRFDLPRTTVADTINGRTWKQAV